MRDGPCMLHLCVHVWVRHKELSGYALTRAFSFYFYMKGHEFKILQGPLSLHRMILLGLDSKVQILTLITSKSPYLGLFYFKNL